MEKNIVVRQYNCTVGTIIIIIKHYCIMYKVHLIINIYEILLLKR